MIEWKYQMWAMELMKQFKQEYPDIVARPYDPTLLVGYALKKVTEGQEKLPALNVDGGRR